IINMTIKKLNADISLTQAKITNSTQIIQKLGLDIGKKDSNINDLHASLGESLRLFRETEDTSLLEQLANDKSFSDFLTSEEHLNDLQGKLKDQVMSLRQIRSDLVDKKTATEAEKKKLQTLQSQLGDQKKIAAANYASKNQLLAQTKNQES